MTQTGSLLHVRFGDGEADLYLSCYGMVANHVSGRDPWQLLVLGAQAADWVVLPLDRPVCLTGPGQRESLPNELGDDVVVVGSGAELLKVVSGT
jgi:hypothetical protein